MFLWHTSHDRVVLKCPDGRPDALIPLWQAWHVLGDTPLWSNCAGNQVDVRWQVSHEVTTIRWRAGMPDAALPS
jgi:hypothetical protein